MQAIGIRTPFPEDQTPLESLITSHFSADSSYDVDLGLNDPARHVRVAAASDGTPVGVMAINVHDDATAVAERMHMYDSTEYLPSAERYGHLQMGYVDEEATGRGIGSRLVEELETVARTQGVTCVLADSWYHGGEDTPEQLFDRNGYETIHRERIEDRTAEDCPKCDPICSCERAMVRKWIDPVE